MNMRSPQFWLALVSLSAVLGYAAATLTRSSPGKITAAHAQDSDLTSPFACASCHGGWLSDMTASCLECHEEIGEQLSAKSGLHGIQHPELARRCQACHSEHHGREFRMVNQASFALAGVDDVDAFDHGVVGYEMLGKHLELACSECHEHADKPVLGEGEFRYLGLEKDCASCHDDPHDGRMTISCSECHTQTAWNAYQAPEHDRYLPLLGAHGELDCSACHEIGGDLDLEVLGARNVRAYKQNCTRCHDSPHDEDVITAVGAAEERSPEASCALCHEADHTSFDDERLAETVTAERHAATGFELVDPHDTQSCDQCHGEVSTGTVQFSADADFGTRHPGRAPSNCVTCHDDVHGGEFDDSPLAPNGCVDCHAATHFDPHEFTVDMHGRTEFALIGTHAETDCNQCHERPDDGVPVFGGTASSCDDCHADAHTGYFEPFAMEIAESSPEGSCAHCHDTVAFDRVPLSRFDHAYYTGLAIEGAHEQAGCESCHPRAEEPDENGRRFGRVRDHFGEYVGCVTCHVDTHEGEFDHPELPTEVRGRVGCARCHNSVSFRNLVEPFDHNLWTGFLLRGAHAQTDCRACHPPLLEPDPDTGRTWQRAQGRDCASCHEDIHQGQFVYRNGNLMDCAACHRVSDTWDDLTFNHDVHSRFRLGAAHEKVECGRCHVQETINGQEAIRYRPIPHRCSDCHGSARSPFSRRRR